MSKMFNAISRIFEQPQASSSTDPYLVMGSDKGFRTIKLTNDDGFLNFTYTETSGGAGGTLDISTTSVLTVIDVGATPIATIPNYYGYVALTNKGLNSVSDTTVDFAAGAMVNDGHLLHLSFDDWGGTSWNSIQLTLGPNKQVWVNGTGYANYIKVTSPASLTLLCVDQQANPSTTNPDKFVVTSVVCDDPVIFN